VTVRITGSASIEADSTLAAADVRFGSSTTVSGTLEVTGTITRETVSDTTVDIDGSFRLEPASAVSPRPIIADIEVRFNAGSESTLTSPVLTGSATLTVGASADIRINGDVDGGDASRIVVGLDAKIVVGVEVEKRQTSSVTIAPSIEGSASDRSGVHVDNVDLHVTGTVDSVYIHAPTTTVTLDGSTTDIDVNCTRVEFNGDASHEGVFTTDTLSVRPGIVSGITATIGTESSIDTLEVIGDGRGPSTVTLTTETTVASVTITGGDSDSRTEFRTHDVVADSATFTGSSIIRPIDEVNEREQSFRVFTAEANADIIIDSGVTLRVRPTDDGDAQATIESDCRISGNGTIHFTGDVTARDRADFDISTTVEGGTLTIGDAVSFRELVLDHATIEGRSSTDVDIAPRILVGTFRSETEENRFVATFSSTDDSTDAVIGVADICVITGIPTIVIRGDAPPSLDGTDTKIVLTCTDTTEVDADVIEAAIIEVDIATVKRANCNMKSKLDGNDIVVYCESTDGTTADSSASGLMMMFIAFIAILI